MAPNPLIGTWRLASWENRSVDGQISYPLGEDAVGYIMYNQSGYMFVDDKEARRRQRASLYRKSRTAARLIYRPSISDRLTASLIEVERGR